MSIQEFHVRISSPARSSALFTALRRVRASEGLVEVLRNEANVRGWYPWHDGGEPLEASAQPS